MSIASLLQREIEGCAERLSQHALMRRAWAGQVQPSTVARYLSSVHFLVQHTPVHLALAVQGAERLGSPDLVDYFRHKLAEEQGHDRWSAADLLCLSQRFALPEVPPPSAAMEQLVLFVEAQIRQSPASYVVYVLFAEYLTVLVGPAWARALQQHCGVPPDALSVVTKHVVLDQSHVSAALAEIEELLALESHAALLDMLRQTIARFEAFCDELEQRDDEPPTSVAA